MSRWYGTNEKWSGLGTVMNSLHLFIVVPVEDLTSRTQRNTIYMNQYTDVIWDNLLVSLSYQTVQIAFIRRGSFNIE